MENLTFDQYKNVVLNIPQAIEVLLRGNQLDGACIDDDLEVELFNRNTELYLEIDEQVAAPPENSLSFEEYHRNLSNCWFMPDKYLNIDVEQYVLNMVSTEIEQQRITHEMKLYRERNLEPVLRLIIYLVDLMREKQIVWGVGRGSSVSSYVLYCIGLHKVNSIKYDLSIEEFLR
jgi:DNA polymerase III alpha subunit